jgi:hypothetical protein
MITHDAVLSLPNVSYVYKIQNPEKTKKQALVLDSISKFPAKLVEELHHSTLQTLTIFLQEDPLFLFR